MRLLVGAALAGSLFVTLHVLAFEESLSRAASAQRSARSVPTAAGAEPPDR